MRLLNSTAGRDLLNNIMNKAGKSKVCISHVETKADEDGTREMTVTFSMTGDRPAMDWFRDFYQKLETLCRQQ